jgi:hypothetical protein
LKTEINVEKTAEDGEKINETNCDKNKYGHTSVHHFKEWLICKSAIRNNNCSKWKSK